MIICKHLLQPAKRVPLRSQNPCEGRGTCDALLINKGRPWDYQVSNWRLTFAFENGDAILVDYQDYH